ncbi:hypothetical protein PT974_04448 [Cladobotryum mycophilum]|uniref:CBM-cenC domain-containing protein n=1 Tax=Cladobotryum mycophilum TaxID=491253 RepID=A0ABR0SV05_9HYPO
MLSTSAVLCGALTLFGSVIASPFDLSQRDACNHDNLLRCFIDQRYSTQATAYCSGLTPSTTTVATVTATSTTTLWQTVTASTETDVITSSVTVFTATVPSATVTVTQAAHNKRDPADPPAPAPPPYCMTNGATYPASRITSACSCINVPASTVSVTYTAGTQTVTETSTSSVTATVTTTSTQTINKVLTSGIKTVTVTPPAPTNLVPNGDFEKGAGTSSIIPWIFQPGVGTWQGIGQVTDGPSGGVSNMAVTTTSHSQSQGWLNSEIFTIHPGSYTLTYSARSTAFLNSGNWGSTVVVEVVCSDKAVWLVTPFAGMAQANSFWAFTHHATFSATLSNCVVSIAFGVQPTTTTEWRFDNVILLQDS